MQREVADENDLSKTTLQHIKGVVSGIFTHAKNEGAFDGANPVQGARIPTNARESAETYAYNLAQICRILEFLPLLPKQSSRRRLLPAYGEASCSGWNGRIIRVTLRQLAEILNTCRNSTGDPRSGVMFHEEAGQHMDFDKLARQVVRPTVESLNIDWYGWRGFRRGIASNLYELGADEKIVQRVLRHAKSHVTKDRYIKAFDRPS